MKQWSFFCLLRFGLDLFPLNITCRSMINFSSYIKPIQMVHHNLLRWLILNQMICNLNIFFIRTSKFFKQHDWLDTWCLKVRVRVRDAGWAALCSVRPARLQRRVPGVNLGKSESSSGPRHGQGVARAAPQTRAEAGAAAAVRLHPQPAAQPRLQPLRGQLGRWGHRLLQGDTLSQFQIRGKF